MSDVQQKAGSFQEVQIDVGDLLARLGLDPPGVLKCNARIDALEKAVIEAAEKAERIEQSLSGGGVGLEDPRTAVPDATAELEETRAQLAALEKRITDLDPPKMMASLEASLKGFTEAKIEDALNFESSRAPASTGMEALEQKLAGVEQSIAALSDASAPLEQLRAAEDRQHRCRHS
jgi:uncharacterized coiled-coil protein SlyX